MHTTIYTRYNRTHDIITMYNRATLGLSSRPQSPPLEEYLQGKGRRALRSYVQNGFIPLENTIPFAFHSGEQVCVSLTSDFLCVCVSLVVLTVGGCIHLVYMIILLSSLFLFIILELEVFTFIIMLYIICSTGVSHPRICV